MQALLAAAAALLLAAAPARADEPLRVYAAGSLGTVLPRIIEASGLPPGTVAAPVFGPAGALAKRIAGGEAADLFASADLNGPRAVAAARPGTLVVPFARNRMCLLGRDGPANAAALVDRMLQPGFRLAASTPGVDPGGDYAQAVFDKADAVHPGAAAALKGKALLLLGGPGSMQPQPGHSPAAGIFLANAADGLLYYCSATDAAAKEAPGLQSVPLPPELEVGPVYGLAILSNRPETARLALFMLSERGQAMLGEAGLLPIR